MKKFKDLYQFVEYCEEINNDTEGFFLLSLVASTSTKEELLEDATKTLTEYYKWLKEAIDEELFNMASIIHKALENEKVHYMELGRCVLKASISKDIKRLDTELKERYLC